MASIPHPDLSQTPRIAIYARVSTEDQAERQTVQAQLDFLHRWADLHEFPIAGVYVDDGWSGTVPLRDRPDGRRLLDDAAAGQFSMVALYRLDRLGRSIHVLLDADRELEGHGVTIRSATEPFDTSSPIGRFVFQLLASIAELERSTITERMTMGRDRVARNGKWTGGPVPFGYDLDADGCLTPSTRLVPHLEQTEAELARSVFERIAAGASATGEARRLGALDVPCERRYAGGAVYAPTGTWRPGRLTRMIQNPLYEGRHQLRSRQGLVERPVPPLVAPELRARACAQLTTNRRMARRNAQQRYLLRGLITCQCGVRYVGMPVQTHGRTVRYYRCGAQGGAIQPDPAKRCRARSLPADRVESEVWGACRAFIHDPGAALDEAQRALRSRLAASTGVESQQRALHQQLAEKEAERERILALYRRNRLTIDEAETHLDAIAEEQAQLRQLLAALASQAALADAYEAHLSEAAALLTRLRDELDEIEATDDWDRKRQVVERLVVGLAVQTEGQGRRACAHIRARFAFGPPIDAVVSPTAPRTGACAPLPRPGSRP
jgi:site-specific DNA recombinase